MKKLILICFPVFFSVIVNAQVNHKPNLNELNQDQLNFALKKSKNTIKLGKILTFAGLGASSIGIVMLFEAGTKSIVEGSDNTTTVTTGAYLMIFGSCTSLIGIPVWIVGANKKHKIELELVKFNTIGSASIKGIGLKKRF